MGYLTKEFINFFKELEKNNNKEWFDENRKRYENHVKKPFAKFIDEMIGRINAEDPEVSIQAKDALLRINRDIRFSPDKTPYNTHFGAIISTTGRKDKSIPGIYFRFSAKGIDIYGGAHGVDKNQLQNIRTYIADNLTTFNKVIGDKEFSQKFGELLGEKHKRIPKEFQEIAAKQPLIANKQFYYGATIAAKHITDDYLADTLMDYWKAAAPVKSFLYKAIQPVAVA